MMKNLLIDLPEDLFINNILLSKVLLLPIESLLSLRCVCKYLRNLITSPAFINMHLFHQSTTASSPPKHQQLNNQLVLIHSNTPEKVFYSLKFNDGDPCHPEEVIMFDYPIKDPKIWGSCNGLLCLTGFDRRRNIVCIWNPSTKEYKELPPPVLPLHVKEITKVRAAHHVVRSITYGFGYDRFNDDYKIIRCDNLVVNNNSIIEYQVYTLGTNTWRKISTDNNPYKSYNFVTPSIQINDKSIVFVNGALHWIVSKKRRSSETVIVSFDIEKEVFGEIQKPLISKLVDDNFSHIHVLRGCLCLFQFHNSLKLCCFNVWMMMDYGVRESWTKLFTIDRNELFRTYYFNTVRLLRFCENGEILFGTNILFAYNPMNNRARHVEFGKSVQLGENVDQSEIYIESLVSLNSGIYKG